MKTAEATAIRTIKANRNILTIIATREESGATIRAVSFPYINSEKEHTNTNGKRNRLRVIEFPRLTGWVWSHVLHRVNRRGFFRPLLLLALFDRGRSGDCRLVQHFRESASISEPRN
jgi:hypothetical protein